MDDGLDLANNLLRFIVAAMGHQPARAFGNEVPNEDNENAEQRSQTKRKAPAQVGGHQPSVQQDDGGGCADRRSDPIGGIDDEVDVSANAGRNQLIDCRVDGRVFTPDAHACDCTKYGKAPEVPAEGAGQCCAEVNQQCDGKEFLATEAIGSVAEADRPDNGADE